MSNLYNTSVSNVLFNSLSNTINAGGTSNDTFIVSKIGTFYYQSMVGNQARQGEYGYFTVELIISSRNSDKMYKNLE